MTPDDGEPGRRELTGRERALLCELADPEGEPPAATAFDGPEALAILRAARDHKVEPVVLRKFRQAGLADRPDLRDYCRAATRDRMYIAAVALALNAQADRITAGFTAAGVPHAIVKGAAFATAIYPDPAERPFSDIDILLPPSARAAASRVMESLEFQLFSRDFLDQSDAKQEQQWGYRGDTQILAELHTDLVHAPTLRRRVSFGYDAHERASAGGERPFAGHFAVAVVHAAIGHKFHPLRLMLDVLQSVRHLSDADIAHLAGVMDDLRLHPEVSMSLALVGALFPAAGVAGRLEQIRDALRLPACWHPVTAKAVLDSTGGEGYLRSRLARHAFRWYQTTIAPRKS